MTRFTVPESFRPALYRIALMSDTEVEALRQALASSPPSLNVSAIVAHVQSILKQVPADLPDTVQTLTHLSNARESVGAPLEHLAREISGQVATREKKVDASALEQRLSVLLNTSSLIISSRAFDVQHEYQKLLVSARIMTDTRHVFSANGNEAVGAMIIHNLILKYSEAGEFKEVVIALDDADILRLKKVLERAELKTASLEKLIEKTGVPYFDSK